MEPPGLLCSVSAVSEVESFSIKELYFLGLIKRERERFFFFFLPLTSSLWVIIINGLSF